MSNPSIKEPALLAKDDIYFKAAVGRCRDGTGVAALSSIASLLMAAMMDATQVLEWLKDFEYTIVADPDRFRAADDSRCSLCRFHKVCPPHNHSCKCKAFMSTLEKEWNVAVCLHISGGYGSDANITFYYDHGFIYNNTEGIRQRCRGLGRCSSTRWTDTSKSIKTPLVTSSSIPSSVLTLCCDTASAPNGTREWMPISPVSALWS